jgi:predicted phosphodiesterase
VPRAGGLARVAALYDIHGNLPALEAVIAEVRDANVDLLLVGGDLYPGPMADASLALLLDLDLPIRFIRGNGDREVLAIADGDAPDNLPEQSRAAMRWAADTLDPKHRRLIAGWPESVRIEIDGLGEVLFCHATPRDDTEIVTRRTTDERLAEILAAANAPLVVCGHTHMQFDRTVGEVRLVNAGSVGMPFGDSGAEWALFGPDVRLMHTDYDLESAAARVGATDYPGADRFAERSILHPPSEREMLDLFARAEPT